ncbi:Lysophospholipid acyltransferase like protein [Verticillium longisporum]|nr:Lysophospholipid acyltransferase like protein [Verticillium longisporum]
MNTNKWLRNYVYLRVTPRGKKPGFRASLMTFGTSALWHGFYPGYYMTFILASLIQTVAKNFRRYVRPFFLDPDSGLPNRKKKYYDLLRIRLGLVASLFLCHRGRGCLDGLLRVSGKADLEARIRKSPAAARHPAWPYLELR